MNKKWQEKIVRVGRKCWRASQVFADLSRLQTYHYLRSHGLGMESFEQWGLPWLKQAGIKTILDIGAHTGEIFCLLKYIFSDANIYSFEPLYDSYIVLLDKVKRYPGSKAYNIALGDFNGVINFYRNDFRAASSALELSSSHKEVLKEVNLFPEAINETKIEVPVARLDDYCLQEQLDLQDNLLIKIDVQGYEDKVILGGEQVFKRAKVVVTEVSFYEIYLGQILFAGINDLMTKLGFQFMGLLSEEKSPIDGKILQADAIFVSTI